MLRHGPKLLYMLQESEPCLDNSETSLLGWWSTLLGGHCFAVTNSPLAHCKTIQIKFSAADIMYIVQIQNTGKAVIVLLSITSAFPCGCPRSLCRHWLECRLTNWTLITNLTTFHFLPWLLLMMGHVCVPSLANVLNSVRCCLSTGNIFQSRQILAWLKTTNFYESLLTHDESWSNQDEDPKWFKLTWCKMDCAVCMRSLP